MRLNVAASAAPGDITVAGRFRYQACDEKMCYLPVSESIQWKLRVVPAGTASRRRTQKRSRRFASGAVTLPLRPLRRPRRPLRAREGSLVRARSVHHAERRRGYLGTDDFLKFIRNAETGVTEKGWFEGAAPRRFSSSCSPAASRSISRRACCR